MDREAWQATVHGFAKSRAQLSMLTVLSRTLQSYSVTQTVKNLPANAGDVRDTGLIPGLGRSPGRGNGNPEYFWGKVPWTEEPDGYSLWSHKLWDMTE